MLKKQVDKTHYQFSNYMDKKRWMSMWHQLAEVLLLNPQNVLEVGKGTGLFKSMAEIFDVTVETVDIDPDLNPDHVASATDLPFKNNSYDCICAFQILEHLPYDQSLVAFSEMVRVARKNIIISLPDAKKLWTYSVHIPKIGEVMLHFPRPQLRPLIHKFDGEHYWEINKLGSPLQKIIDDFTRNNVNILKMYRVPENPYHRFFVFEKIPRGQNLVG
ncbi:MAG: class I SAM-dependent methyltransferase [Proteobacteria bacterium]|nr:class I SAM-dependent methyltransferase [Pseudomonadota bacterium]